MLVGGFGVVDWVDLYIEYVLVPGSVCNVVDFFYSKLRLDPPASRCQDAAEAGLVYHVGLFLLVPWG